MHKFVLSLQKALGDVVCMSALVRDIQLAYPGEYEVCIAENGHFKSFWENNPHCRLASPGEVGQRVNLEYGEGIKAAGRGSKIHFLSWFHKDFESKVAVPVPVFHPKGDIHLSRDEKTNRLLNSRYWVVVAGGKLDMTAKVWYIDRYQEVVDELLKRGIRCVQAGADHHKHFHPRLKNCELAIGKTRSIRDFFSLIYHAEGVICGVTAAAHIAAVFDKPCVVIAGGREEPWWENYLSSETFGPQCSQVKVPHKYLHTIGVIDCGVGNLTKGCWKARTVAIEQADHSSPRERDKLCRKPIRTGPQPMPECMALIGTDMVVDAVLSYYEDGILPPPGEPMQTKKWIWQLKETNQTIEVPSVLPPISPAVVTPPLSQISLMRMPAEVKSRAGEDPELAVLDHPFIGGKVTICVLCYGDHLALAQRCIGSILTYAPEHRLDLRVALNQPSKKLLDYVSGFPKDIVTKIYPDFEERRKYPAMREMFWDEAHPITTKYVLWFDDDSHVIDKKWLVLLGRDIVANQLQGCHMYGTKYIHDLMPYKRQGFNPEKWFHEATWWRNVWLRLGKGAREASNGSELLFCTGGFWAISLEAIRKADIPDRRLGHSGGDVCLGEQLHQAGYKIKDFSRNKTPVRWSDAPRRGVTESFLWSKYV